MYLYTKDLDFDVRLLTWNVRALFMLMLFVSTLLLHPDGVVVVEGSSSSSSATLQLLERNNFSPSCKIPRVYCGWYDNPASIATGTDVMAERSSCAECMTDALSGAAWPTPKSNEKACEPDYGRECKYDSSTGTCYPKRSFPRKPVLTPPPNRTGASVCGNGVVEAGEQCDVVGASCCVNCRWVQPSYDAPVAPNDAVICRMRTRLVNTPNGVGLRRSPEYLMRYNVQGEANEPLPIYVQPKADGSGIKVAWTDNSTAGIFNADRVHLTDLRLDPTTGSYVVKRDDVINGREVRGFYSSHEGWDGLLVRTSVDEKYVGYPRSAHSNGEYGAFKQDIELRRYNTAADGGPIHLDWSQGLEPDLNGDNAIGRVNDFGIGDARLVYDSNRRLFVMNYKISTGALTNWHEIDVIRRYTVDTAVETPFSGGNLLCSHSQENRAAYNPRSKRVGLACLADGEKYGGISFFMHASDGKRVHSSEVHRMESWKHGYVDGSLGALIADTTSLGFIAIYTAVRFDYDLPGNKYTSELESNTDIKPEGGPGTDVVIARISSDGFKFSVTKKWLTNTTGVSETSAHVTAYGSSQYLVSWRQGLPTLGKGNRANTCYDGTGNPSYNHVKYFVAIVDATSLEIVKGPEETSHISGGMFNERDDFVTLSNGDAVWVAQGSPDDDPNVAVQFATELTSLRVTTIRVPNAPAAATCGNGVIDYWAGETCDETNACCINCQLAPGAQCTPGTSTGCCEGCLYKAATSACPIDGNVTFDVAKECRLVSAADTSKPLTTRSEILETSHVTLNDNCGSCRPDGSCGIFEAHSHPFSNGIFPGKGNQNADWPYKWCPLNGGESGKVNADPCKTVLAGVSKTFINNNDRSVRRVCSEMVIDNFQGGRGWKPEFEFPPEGYVCGVDTAAKTSAICDGAGKCGPMRPSVETPQPPCPSCGTTYRGTPAARLFGIVPKPVFTPNYICTGCPDDKGGMLGAGAIIGILFALLFVASLLFLLGGAYVPNVALTKIFGATFWNKVRRVFRMEEVAENKTEEKGRERMTAIAASLSAWRRRPTTTTGSKNKTDNNDNDNPLAGFLKNVFNFKKNDRDATNNSRV